MAGQSLSDPDQSHPQAMSKLGYQARRPGIGPIDLRADVTFVGQVRVSLADEGGELPVTTVHGLFSTVSDC
jgi:hypothetical protein